MEQPERDGAPDAEWHGTSPGSPGLRGAVEAVLMVVDEPVTAVDLATALEVPAVDVERILVELRRDYDGNAGQTPRGFELRSVAGGWRIYSRPEFADVVSRFVLEGQTARLTQAALETLAIVAYRQPVSRTRVSGIRGVSADSAMRTLVQRGLVEESGADPESGALLYRTTSYFLERLGLESLAELPDLAPHLPGLDQLADYDQGGY